MKESLLYQEALALLQQLITTPSFSKNEDKAADIIEQFFVDKKIKSERLLNNVWAVNRYFDAAKKTILLNSHLDTVNPNSQYTRNPFEATIDNEKLFGLGSNDAGACLVSLIAAFIFFHNSKNLKYNIVVATTAEEEISGVNGIEKLLSSKSFVDTIGKPAFAIVGEPTLTNMAIAEKGLLVLDCVSIGKAGHAARSEGENAIYKAMQDIQWFQTFKFPKISALLGETKMSVTSICTQNKLHNVVPAECSFVVDIRVTDVYSLEEIMDTIKQHVHCTVTPRSIRLHPSKIDASHPLVIAGSTLGKQIYGSPTTSDAALINAPVLKCGPGDSARSHTADEFIYLDEIKDGIKTYIGLLEQIVF